MKTRYHHHRPQALLAALLSLTLLAHQAHGQIPSISISGLDGAEHWVIFEGEDRTSGGGLRRYVSSTGVPISGFLDGDDSMTGVRGVGSAATPSEITWQFHAPAAMSENTALYAHAVLGPTSREFTISLDGEVIATPTMFKRGHATVPGQWIGFGSTSNFRADLTSISAGEHTFKVVSTAYEWGWDALLLYDGTPALRSVNDNGTGRSWLSAPRSAGNPTLLNPVAPVLTINGLQEGNVVRYLLNGQVYTPGTLIDIGEGYELSIAIFESADPNSQRLAFAGANFSIIPEPGTYALVGMGLLGVMWRMRRKRSSPMH